MNYGRCRVSPLQAIAASDHRHRAQRAMPGRKPRHMKPEPASYGVGDTTGGEENHYRQRRKSIGRVIDPRLGYLRGRSGDSHELNALPHRYRNHWSSQSKNPPNEKECVMARDPSTYR